VGPDERLRLVCAFCKRRILTLAQAYVSWPARCTRPVEVQWCHKRCGQRAQPKRKLWQGEYALRSLITSLLEEPALPRVPPAHLDGSRRPWGLP
jgi:hypothetical protein